MAINIASKSTPDTFKKALNKLAADSAFREKVKNNPEALTGEFHLSLQELHALRQVAILSGVDMTQINKVRADAIARSVGPRGGLLADTDINVSCCCCCCCGETAVVRTFA